MAEEVQKRCLFGVAIVGRTGLRALSWIWCCVMALKGSNNLRGHASRCGASAEVTLSKALRMSLAVSAYLVLHATRGGVLR